MPARLVMMSVRLDPYVIRELDTLREQYQKEKRTNPITGKQDKPTRSDLIRHAITAGIDTLLDNEPIEL